MRSVIRKRFGWRGGVAVIEVLTDGLADGPAPRVVAEGAGVFVLGKMDGLGEGLREIGEGAGRARLDVPAGYAGDEAGDGGAEIAGGEVLPASLAADRACQALPAASE